MNNKKCIWHSIWRRLSMSVDSSILESEFNKINAIFSYYTYELHSKTSQKQVIVDKFVCTMYNVLQIRPSIITDSYNLCENGVTVTKK